MPVAAGIAAAEAAGIAAAAAGIAAAEAAALSAAALSAAAGITAAAVGIAAAEVVVPHLVFFGLIAFVVPTALLLEIALLSAEIVAVCLDSNPQLPERV